MYESRKMSSTPLDCIVMQVVNLTNLRKLTFVTNKNEKTIITQHETSVTSILCRLRLGYSSITLEMMASICTNCNNWRVLARAKSINPTYTAVQSEEEQHQKEQYRPDVRPRQHRYCFRVCDESQSGSACCHC